MAQHHAVLRACGITTQEPWNRKGDCYGVESVVHERALGITADGPGGKDADSIRCRGFEQLIKPGDIVAIKIHCGEYNNTLICGRSIHAPGRQSEGVGGAPFVCDTNNLDLLTACLARPRLDLLMTAERNGFTSAALGCPSSSPMVSSGTSDYRVDLPEGYILKEAYVAQAIAAPTS